MAKLYFRYGTMNCGKTTQLLQVAYNYEERGMKVIVLKPKIDTKGNNVIVSRLGAKRKVDYLIEGDTSIVDIINKTKEIDCILVDEAQFLNKNQIDELLYIVINNNIPIICYGLRTDFKMNGFPGSTRLLEIAHIIEELKTICMCGKKALFVIRKINGNAVFDGEQVVIDDKDNVTYVSVCGKCYYEEKCKIKALNK